jgi:AcrR family transcriptional regulator
LKDYHRIFAPPVVVRGAESAYQTQIPHATPIESHHAALLCTPLNMRFYPNLEFRPARAARLAMIRKPAIFDATANLIATKDYDFVGVAEIAKRSNCSTGVLYCRFQNKEALLTQLSADTFMRLTAELGEWLGKTEYPAETMLERIVRRLTDQLTAPKVAGVVRATVKLGMTRPAILKPLGDYRRAATRLAVTSLRERDIAHSETRIEAAVQTAIGAAIDSLVTGARPRTDAIAEMTGAYVD